MTTAYTSLLGLALPVTGELSGTWGDTVNNSITSLLDSAIAGTTTLSADTTLTTTTGASNQARQAILLCTGHVANITITAPAQSKIYTVINASATYTVKIRGAGPTTGITIPVSSTATVAWNGSDFVDASGYINGNLKVNGTLTVTGTATIGGNTAVTGTLSATGLLTVGTADTAYAGVKINGVGTVAGISPIYFGGSGSQGIAGIAGVVEDGAVNTAGGLGFYTRTVTSNTAPTERMRLDSSGNLGIGTTSPAYKLVVAGTAPRIVSQDTTSNYITVLRGGNTLGYVGTESNIPFAIVTNGNTAATFDTSGNLGLGVTPSVWNSNFKALQISTGGSLSAAVSQSSLVDLGGNFYQDSGGTERYIASSSANKYRQYAGVHSWYTAASGTAGNAITFTQAMTLDASGNLGIGNTSPASYNSDADNLVIGTSGNSGMTIVSGSTSSGYIMFADGTTGQQKYEGQITYDHTNNFMAFNTSATERMRLDSSGNVGIGTSSPAVTLSVAGTIGVFGGSLNGSIGSPQLYRPVSDTLAIATGAVERMRIDSSGNLGIGTTAPQNKLQVKTTVRPQFSVSYDGITGLYLEDSSNSVGKSWKIATSTAGNSQLEFYQSTATSGVPVWAATAAMTLDASGNLLVGATATGQPDANYFMARNASGFQANIGHATGTASGQPFVYMVYGGVAIGSITQNGTTAVAYNTSSDYRLKNTIAPMTGALAKVALLKPCTYKWNADGSDGQGFIAHELAEIVPQCVTGAKDGVDEDGNPQYQGIDTSFLVATLTAALQEQQALITTLTARITALEGA